MKLGISRSAAIKTTQQMAVLFLLCALYLGAAYVLGMIFGTIGAIAVWLFVVVVVAWVFFAREQTKWEK